MGEVLSMECKDRKQKLVAYLLKSLNETERNYEIHNKKMLAVIRGLEDQKYLLESTKFKFEVWTNYKNLEYFMKVSKLNKRKAHWILYFLRFGFTLKHVLGTKTEKIDKISRKPDWKVENNNKNHK